MATYGREGAVNASKAVTEGPVTRFSPDRRYRYLLTRQISMWEGPSVTFVMLNPSTADESKNDPTVTRCIGFAKRWGASTLYVVNLSPLRATDPQELIEAGPEPVGIRSENLFSIADAADRSDIIVAAWGTLGGLEGRADLVLHELEKRHHRFYCLERTKHGHPRHPLYVRADTDPVEYNRPHAYQHGGKAV